MGRYQQLLLITHLALRHSPVIDHAAALAKASAARLHIAALIPVLNLLSLLEEGDREKTRERYLQDHRDWLGEQAKKLHARGVDVTTELAWADDMEKDILDHFSELQPDLLIKEIQHESVLKRAFFTPLDWRLLRYSPVPVYLVGGVRPALPCKVVAAVEASLAEPGQNELNDRVIRQACSLAEQCDAELHLLYAYDISQDYQASDTGLTLSELTRWQRKALEQSFLKLASRYNVPPGRRHFVLGHPVAALSEFANTHHMDVIVMGRVQDPGGEKLLGSTTEHILYQVPCSVLAV